MMGIVHKWSCKPKQKKRSGFAIGYLVRDDGCCTQMVIQNPNKKKVSSCACQLSSEVTPYHSGSLSHHWGHRRVLLALLPAWAGAPIIIHQDITAYAALPLWSAHLVRASHQRGQKDIIRAHTLHWPASTRMTGERDPSQLMERWNNKCAHHKFNKSFAMCYLAMTG